MHIAVGSTNTLTWKRIFTPIITYFKRNPLPKSASSPSFALYKSKFVLETLNKLRKVPVNVMIRLARALGFKKMNRKARKLGDYLDRAKEYSYEYSYYTNNEWIFANKKMHELKQWLTPSESALLSIELKDINWD